MFFWLILYVIDFLKMYLSIFYLCSIQKIIKQKELIIHAVVCLFIFSVTFQYGIADKQFVLPFVILEFLHIFILLHKKKFFLIEITAFAVIITIDTLLGELFSILTGLEVDVLSQMLVPYLITNSLSLVLVCILVIIKLLTGKNRLQSITIYSYKRSIIVPISIGMGVAAVMVGFWQAVSFRIHDKVFDIIFLVIATLFSICFATICFLLMNGHRDFIYSEERTKIIEKLIVQQNDYYTQLLEQEEETRKFRHDIKNHLYCLTKLCEEKQYGDMEKYLKDLASITVQTKKHINTGNRILDIVVSDLLRGIEDRVTINWSGHFPEQVQIAEVDLCALFSNLLKNAIEASLKLSDTEVKKIDVEVRQLRSNLIVEISNRCMPDSLVNENKLFVTTKKDKKNHGYGQLIVEDVVKKNHGDMSINVVNDLFKVRLVLFDTIKRFAE